MTSKRSPGSWTSNSLKDQLYKATLPVAFFVHVSIFSYCEFEVTCRRWWCFPAKFKCFYKGRREHQQQHADRRLLDFSSRLHSYLSSTIRCWCSLPTFIRTDRHLPGNTNNSGRSSFCYHICCMWSLTSNFQLTTYYVHDTLVVGAPSPPSFEAIGIYRETPTTAAVKHTATRAPSSTNKKSPAMRSLNIWMGSSPYYLQLTTYRSIYSSSASPQYSASHVVQHEVLPYRSTYR